MTGTLAAPDRAGRWAEFVDRTCRPGYWDTLTEHYPTMHGRLDSIVDNRMAAAVTFAERFAGDRTELSEMDLGEPGELLEVSFGAGGGRCGGRTVALLRHTTGRLVYKPRSVAVDRALARLLTRVVPDEPDPIRVPRVLVRDGYGWTEHVEHRYCADEEELRRFHRNLGRWLAVLRLVGGAGPHQENLIAAGPVPVVVDCDTVFAPYRPAPPSGYGDAVDQAHELVDGVVLGTSAVGSLLGQQTMPVVLDDGGHPSADPVLGRYRDTVVAAFTEQTERLHGFDRYGDLARWLADFAGTPIRVVPRATETYAELGRTLWHPTTLHDQEPAVAKAEALLAEHAAGAPDAPGDPAVIAAEVAELLGGDLPVFTTTPAVGTLTGPGGTTCGERTDLVAAALHRWRAQDAGREQRAVRAALVSAYLNENRPQKTVRRHPSTVDAVDAMDTVDTAAGHDHRHSALERHLDGHGGGRGDDGRTAGLGDRRRALAAGIVGQVVATAITARDGTVSWVAPVHGPTGWSVHVLGNDLYGGTPGIAVLLAGQLREQEAGRAEEVPGVEKVLRAAVRTMRLAERHEAAEPEPPGGYLGLGSRICGWLLLRRLGAVGDDALEWAGTVAGRVPRAVAQHPAGDQAYDILAGRAGAIVPLLRLAEHTGERRWVELAGTLGDQLVAGARAAETPSGADTVCWPDVRHPDGTGGVAHGATGIGWALARLAEVTGDPAHGDTARAAFAYRDTLDGTARRDPRRAGAWCHGAVGVGLTELDLLYREGDLSRRETVRRAAGSAWEEGTGWSQTLCHGDLGVWELVTEAIALDLGPPGLVRSTVDAQVVGTVAEHGVVTGTARDAFAPGLMAGAGGVAYQLLRLHHDCDLPSVLLPDPGPVAR
ncbi:MAG: DUF4135 domain-containing protein [Actinophytocola sp.]|nr:DUF4135 domain-containing protein [Actinophytocola sp.]